MNWYGYIPDLNTLNDIFRTPNNMFVAGNSIGIIAMDLQYPKIPGNVANATTFNFPVMYKKVRIEKIKLRRGDPDIKNIIVDAALELERDGARIITGACGFFANFQNAVSDAVKVPTFMSSIIQLPMIKLGLKPSQKIGILTASPDDLTDNMLKAVGANPKDCILGGVRIKEGFAPVREDMTVMDNALFCKDVVNVALEIVQKNPEIGAILLECSDLPPYAHAIQKTVGLPVFDFITMINWAHHAVVQKPYYGYF